MGKRKAGALLKAEIKSHKNWLETGDAVREMGVRSYKIGVAEGSIPSLSQIASGFLSLAIYYAHHGSEHLLQGQPEGWEKVHLSCHFHLWVLKISHRLHLRGYSEADDLLRPTIAACNLSYALACDLPEWIRNAKSILDDLIANPELPFCGYWKTRRFEPFAAKLARLAAGEPAESLCDKRLGVYDEVFGTWNEDARFLEALHRVCDYHCDYIYGGRADRDPEFGYPPYGLIPWEILAIRRIWIKQGRAMPIIDHPLMVEPFISPTEPQEISHEFLPRAIKLFQQYFPGQ